MSNTNYTNKRELAKQFLKACNAKEISFTKHDTWQRTVYEIDVIDQGKVITEVWIERESLLEEPEYFYTLKRFEGEDQ